MPEEYNLHAWYVCFRWLDVGRSYLTVCSISGDTMTRSRGVHESNNIVKIMLLHVVQTLRYFACESGPPRYFYRGTLMGACEHAGFPLESNMFPKIY